MKTEEQKQRARERAKAWREANPERHKARQEKCRKANPEKYKATNRRNHLRRRFGITPEKYEEMLQWANYSCEICGVHMSEEKQSLAVDHCHETGKLRGLLCKTCNSAIARLGDTYETVKRATDYLKERG